jgi:hypothetical protein
MLDTLPVSILSHQLIALDSMPATPLPADLRPDSACVMCPVMFYAAVHLASLTTPTSHQICSACRPVLHASRHHVAPAGRREANAARAAAAPHGIREHGTFEGPRHCKALCGGAGRHLHGRWQVGPGAGASLDTTQTFTGMQGTLLYYTMGCVAC